VVDALPLLTGEERELLALIFRSGHCGMRPCPCTTKRPARSGRGRFRECPANGGTAVGSGQGTPLHLRRT
jgi:hypothetical protein